MSLYLEIPFLCHFETGYWAGDESLNEEKGLDDHLALQVGQFLGNLFADRDIIKLPLQNKVIMLNRTLAP